MAVVSLASTLTPASGATLRTGTAGTAIAAGEVVYLNNATNRLERAVANAAPAAAAAVGVAINSAALGQPVQYVERGDLLAVGTVKPGQVYLVANVAGDLAEGTDDLTEDTSYVTVVAVGLTASSIRVGLLVSGTVLNLT